MEQSNESLIMEQSELSVNENNTINLLPVELLEQILQFLSFPDCKNAALVCKRWREICSGSVLANKFLFSFHCFYKNNGLDYLKHSVLPLRMYPFLKINQCCLENESQLFELKLFLIKFKQHVKTIEFHVYQDLADLMDDIDSILNLCNNAEGVLELRADLMYYFVDAKIPENIKSLVFYVQEKMTFTKALLDYFKGIPQNVIFKNVKIDNFKRLESWYRENNAFEHLVDLFDEGLYDIVNQNRNHRYTFHLDQFQLKQPIKIADIQRADLKVSNVSMVEKFLNLNQLALTPLSGNCLRFHIPNGKFHTEISLPSIKQLNLYNDDGFCLDCLETILKSCLDVTDLTLDLYCISSEHLELISNLALLLEHLALTSKTFDGRIRHHNLFGNLKNLKDLNLSDELDYDKANPMFTDNVVLNLGFLPNLKTLYIDVKPNGLTMNTPENILKIATRVPSLESLRLAATSLDKDTLEMIFKSWPNLKGFHVDESSVETSKPHGSFDEEAIRIIKNNCKSLIHLSYDFCMKASCPYAKFSYKLPLWTKPLYEEMAKHCVNRKETAVIEAQRFVEGDHDHDAIGKPAYI